MKSFAFTLLPLAVSALAIDKPAAPPAPVDINAQIAMLLQVAPHQAGYEVKTERLPRLRTDSIKKTVRYGPYTIPAKDVRDSSVPFAEKGELQAFNKIDAVCQDCFVLRTTMYVEYENGTLADASTGIYNHHAVTYNGKKRPMALDCKAKTFGESPTGYEIFSSSAADQGGLESFQKPPEPGAAKKGVYAAPDTNLLLMSELMNYKDHAQKVYLVTESEYLPGKPAGFLDKLQVIVSVTGCDADFGFFVPEGNVSRVSPEFTVPKDVTVVNMFGHMHDGGESVSLMVNQKQVCLSQATYGESMAGMSMKRRVNGMGEGGITDMSRCTQPLQLKKGDKISIKANYDIVKHPMRESTTGEKETVMGLGVFELGVPIGSSYP